MSSPSTAVVEVDASARVGCRCPVCGGCGRPFRSADHVARDIAQTERHHAMNPATGPVKLMHREAVPLEGCDQCGTLWRAAPHLWHSAVHSYERDRYGAEQIAALHRGELVMAARDEPWLVEQGIRRGARLVEVASYVGGLLAFAGAKGASIVGVDPNPELVAWCCDRGLDARCGTLEMIGLPRGEFDGVWILNCLDQVPDPHELVATAAGLLRPGGRLVIRTPNASFIRAAYAPDAGHQLVTAARRHVLWGMPHLCCYTAGALASLVRAHGLEVDTVRARPSDDAPVVGSSPPWFDLVAVAPGRGGSKSGGDGSTFRG